MTVGFRSDLIDRFGEVVVKATFDTPPCLPTYRGAWCLDSVIVSSSGQDVTPLLSPLEESRLIGEALMIAEYESEDCQYD
jgi:hypothetical protein